MVVGSRLSTLVSKVTITSNFSKTCQRLYIPPCSSNFVLWIQGLNMYFFSYFVQMKQMNIHSWSFPQGLHICNKPTYKNFKSFEEKHISIFFNNNSKHFSSQKKCFHEWFVNKPFFNEFWQCLFVYAKYFLANINKMKVLQFPTL